jgi:hypothetical protein
MVGTYRRFRKRRIRRRRQPRFPGLSVREAHRTWIEANPQGTLRDLAIHVYAAYDQCKELSDYVVGEVSAPPDLAMELFISRDENRTTESHFRNWLEPLQQECEKLDELIRELGLDFPISGLGPIR